MKIIFLLFVVLTVLFLETQVTECKTYLVEMKDMEIKQKRYTLF